MTTPISSTAAASYSIDSLNGEGKAVSNPKGQLDNQAFLNLLVAQLRFQDPMKPTDSAALMQQTSTLSQVEMIKDMTAAQHLSTASALIGRTVTYIDAATGVEASGVVESAGKVAGKTTLQVSGKEAELTSVTRIS
ncbi:MAG: hypothetical protein M9952_04975 [Microthrixaceae bacterium]|nr:hypothetical protein [Microthrixaceae bacterium]MCO5312274.1 hypothetical protein [Microthrixaceae bacterium]HPB44432.1 flagellar hook capping FlgD N-terminal domain-containing protein [Microthrixaceae bacterium]